MSERIKNFFREPLAAIADAAAEVKPALRAVEFGTVTSMNAGIVRATGLSNAGYLELVHITAADGSAHTGMIIDLLADAVQIAMLDAAPGVAAGAEVTRTGRSLEVPVGTSLIGRVVNGLGEPLDDRGAVAAEDHWPVERDSPPIMDRQAVTVPLATGILAVDALIPIGRGQRELIVGDRQCGKTAIALDTIINQKGQDVVAIYCAIGMPLSSVATAIAELRSHGAMEHTICVVSSGEDTPGHNFITPFAATAMGEYLMAKGRDVLIVYDDLTHHARSYRELSLLLRRPPAREAFPGDIFYLHSRLLERATHLSYDNGGGSLTALPIVETEAENISAYIPTNLISITDGQIYVSPRLFSQAQLPAIDVMRSVSRVGGQAQLPGYRGVTGELRLSFAQFEELEAFSRFDAAADENTRKALERGRRVREVLKQVRLSPRSVMEQIALILVLNAGILDAVPIETVSMLIPAFIASLRNLPQTMTEHVLGGHRLTDGETESIIAAGKKIFQASAKDMT
ncbi:MAG: F0F1 ATP synthase subunit alpha [Spirochaetes bacterium]|nr:F0F1 ATP synthase subunit alpha [Spirochaetota bacterium]